MTPPPVCNDREAIGRIRGQTGGGVTPPSVSSIAKRWKKIGGRRRSGVATPLFSLYSKKSIGIGELPDLPLLVDWARSVGMSLVQLLPINDTGFNFRPYDAESSFALDPMYLSLERLAGADVRPFAREIERLRGAFPAGGRVRYGVKRAKLETLQKIFERQKKLPDFFKKFAKDNEFWLRPYALFKVIKEQTGQKGWEDWPEALSRRDESALRSLETKEAARIKFHEWLQWQLYRQFLAVKGHARKKRVFLLGDLPFFVSRDSADVWSNPQFFKLDSAAGAPPDLCFPQGQAWGMPPYDWENISNSGYDYLIRRLRYAENFYDLYRVDHFVGIFRIWTVPLESLRPGGVMQGGFDPPDERLWEERGRRILRTILENTRMLPCAEDLGTVPECSQRVLSEFAIPGVDIQRWNRDWGKSYDFTPPQGYRENSIAAISTHDLSPLKVWWEVEAGTVDETAFRGKCQSRGVRFDEVKDTLFDPEKSSHGRLRWRESVRDVGRLLKVLGLQEERSRDFIDAYLSSHDEKRKFWRYLGMKGRAREKCTPLFIYETLKKAGESASIFSVQLLQDWLSLADLPQTGAWDYRINFPGTTSDRNWSLVVPVSLEKMKRLAINKTLKAINRRTGRV